MTTSLHNITSTVEALASVQHTLDFHVVTAKQEGASWAEIGAALGVSKQAAAQRYGKAVTAAAAAQEPAAAVWTETPQLAGQTSIKVVSEPVPADGQDFYACDAEGCDWTITTPIEDWKQRERAIDHHELEHSVGARITAVVAGNTDDGRGNCDDLGNVVRIAGTKTLRHTVYNGSHAVKKCDHCGASAHYKERSGYWMYEGCSTTTKDHRDFKAGKR